MSPQQSPKCTTVPVMIACACGYTGQVLATKTEQLGSPIYAWVCPECSMGHIVSGFNPTSSETISITTRRELQCFDIASSSQP
jgi:hypothetical protein